MIDPEYKKVSIEENREEQNFEESATYGYGVRHIQAVLVFFCITLSYATRAHLGVTIVAMTMPTNTNNVSQVSDITVILKENITSIRGHNKNFTFPNIISTTKYEHWSGIHRTYDWPKSTQEMVLGTFFFGYTVMMFPMGIISQRWGWKKTLQSDVAVNAVLTFFSPWLIAWGDWKALCTIRVLQGFFQAGLYPGIMRFVTYWVPVSERASLTSYIYTGAGLGTVLAFQLAGILCFSQYGWPSSFWVHGVACFVAFILLTIFGTTTPTDSKLISKAEKNFIRGKIKTGAPNKANVPWKAIFTSVPAWATFITHSANALCYAFIFIQVPTYMTAILKLNILKSGILSSLPYIASFFGSIAFGFFSDFFTNRKLISLRNARRLSNSIACFIPGLCLALVSYTQDTAVVVVCFIVSMTANAAIHTGWLVNYVDLSPNYSGALMATGNTIFGILLLILPIVVSYIVTDVTNRCQWRIIMTAMATMTNLCNFIFVIFMSADVQTWNDAGSPYSEPESIKLRSKEQNEKTETAKNYFFNLNKT